MIGARWLTAWVGDVPLAFPLDEVRETILWIPAQPAPPGSPGFVGILPLRGESWPVWDIRRAWGWPSRAPGPDTSYVLGAREDGSGRGAFVVDRVGWVVEGTPEPVYAGRGDKSGFATAVTDASTGTVHFVISPCGFVESHGNVAEGA